MKYEKVLSRKGAWPLKLKIGLFKARDWSFGANIRVRPIGLIYLYLPRLFKFWLSLEREVISVMYAGFIKMPKRGKKC